MRRQFDPAAMRADDAYVVPDEPDQLVELMADLRRYHQGAASKGYGMLIYLS